LADKKRDFYEVLGVDKSAGEADIKKAFRTAAKKHHPDMNPDDPTAEAKFKEVNEAYEVLSDPEKKARYDQFGHAGVDPNFGAGGGADFGDFGGFGDLGDIFGSIFGGFGGGFGGRSANPNAPRRGEDLQKTVVLSFEEAAMGCRKEIEYKRVETCSDCGGTGAKGGTDKKTCPDCGGSGYIRINQRTPFGTMQTQRACEKCGGGGSIIENPCPKCGGHGRCRVTRKEVFEFPAGIDDGQAMTVRGKGNAGANNGPSGDIILAVTIRPHPILEREGYNVHCPVSLSFWQAAMGTEIDVVTLEGNQKVRVPAGTQPNDTMTLKGKGVTRLHSRGKGDQILHFTVAVPKKLTSEQEKGLESIRSLFESDGAGKGKKGIFK
jgi:molecular chaperone DnaJ